MLREGAMMVTCYWAHSFLPHAGLVPSPSPPQARGSFNAVLAPPRSAPPIFNGKTAQIHEVSRDSARTSSRARERSRRKLSRRPAASPPKPCGVPGARARCRSEILRQMGSHRAWCLTGNPGNPGVLRYWISWWAGLCSRRNPEQPEGPRGAARRS